MGGVGLLAALLMGLLAAVLMTPREGAATKEL